MYSSETGQDANRYQQTFSSDMHETLHRVIPALESFFTRWEKKSKDKNFEIFHAALKAGLEKLDKYYLEIDNTRVYILALRE